MAETGAEALLAQYRRRGTAEKDFGDWKQALDLALSSAPRPKAHYRGRAVEAPTTEPDSFAANEARLLLGLVAANLLHAGSRTAGAGGDGPDESRALPPAPPEGAGRVVRAAAGSAS